MLNSSFTLGNQPITSESYSEEVCEMMTRFLPLALVAALAFVGLPMMAHAMTTTLDDDDNPNGRLDVDNDSDDATVANNSDATKNGNKANDPKTTTTGDDDKQKKSGAKNDDKPKTTGDATTCGDDNGGGSGVTRSPYRTSHDHLAKTSLGRGSDSTRNPATSSSSGRFSGADCPRAT